MNPPSTPERTPTSVDRRRFLKRGVTFGAALAAGRPITGHAQLAPDDPSKVLGGPLRPYGERSRFEQSVRERPPGGLEEFGWNLTPIDETYVIHPQSVL